MSVAVDAGALRLALFTDTYAPQMNGVTRTLERLVDAIGQRGGVARVFTVRDPDALPKKPSSPTDIIRYPSIPFWAYDTLRLSWPLQRRVNADVAEFAPTLVHAATEFGVGLAGRRAARAMGIPFVSSYHTSFSAYARFYKLGWLAGPGWSYLRWFHNSGLRTYCPTQAIVDEVAARGFTNTAIWTRGVDTARFSPRFRSTRCRERMSTAPETLVVAYVGRLAAEKGLEVGLEALQLATAARPGAIRFAAVGDGPLEDDVRRRAPAGSWIPGALHGDDLSEAYASADVFLFPSVTDTLGNVLLEAMASGLPVVGADVGPTRELVGEDRGWLVQWSSARAFADALIALVDDRARLHRARAHALVYASTRAWADVWDALIADYLRFHLRETATPEWSCSQIRCRTEGVEPPR